MVDSRGPRLGVGLGAVLLGLGYFAIYIGSSRCLSLYPTLTFLAFNSKPGTFNVATLCLFSFMTGCGSCAAFLAALKTGDTNIQKLGGH